MTTTVKSGNKLRLVTLTGLFSAVIYLVTAFVHIPTGVGYTHPGDGIVYLAASVLPTPYAAAACAIGGALADGLSGFAVWIPATVAIKALTALFFTNKTKKIICLRNLAAIIPSLILCVVGYSLYEGVVIAGGFSAAAIAAAFTQTPFYCIQVAISSAVYILLGTAFDKTKLGSMI